MPTSMAATKTSALISHGHKKLTDLYLLALAVHHGGCFVSFDARVPLGAVAGARRPHWVTLLAA